VTSSACLLFHLLFSILTPAYSHFFSTNIHAPFVFLLFLFAQVVTHNARIRRPVQTFAPRFCHTSFPMPIAPRVFLSHGLFFCLLPTLLTRRPANDHQPPANADSVHCDDAWHFCPGLLFLLLTKAFVSLLIAPEPVHRHFDCFPRHP